MYKLADTKNLIMVRKKMHITTGNRQYIVTFINCYTCITDMDLMPSGEIKDHYET